MQALAGPLYGYNDFLERLNKIHAACKRLSISTRQVSQRPAEWLEHVIGRCMYLLWDREESPEHRKGAYDLAANIRAFAQGYAETLRDWQSPYGIANWGPPGPAVPLTCPCCVDGQEEGEIPEPVTPQ